MKTKEAIEYLKLCKLENIGYRGKDYDHITDLLKRGERFEAIIKELKQYCLILENQSILKEIVRLEQKYFPKPESKYDLCKQDIIYDAKRREMYGYKKFKDFYYYIGVADTLLDTENITVEESIELNNVIQKYLKD